ncbi:DUF551 domain-containing protein [Klebsiella pneumoniae]|uniref:DUF551 domain-containing protein n=1 Tax=Klebsiella pneumoniae TaxID=573 RepID=UPI002931EF7E|nr:DUF551 domain-containing protein [Klebsiella pneumoniae]
MIFENWTIEDLIARCTDFDEMTLEMDREEFAALRRKITELKQAGNPQVIPGAEQRISDAVELLKKAAPAMLADNSGPDGPLAGRVNSPVIPDGYVMVPKEPTEAMCDISHIGVDVYCGITDDNEYYSIGGAEAAKVWKAMLAAAPQSPGSEPATVPGKWIPVSEQMPKRGQEVLCTDQFENYETALYDAGYIPGPPFFATTAGEFHPTHWMPLPAAPQEVKGE